MSKRPWMPLYIGDYLADTGHLSARDHGSYLLLIMHYWQNDGLPADDRKLARIAKVSWREWPSLRETMQDFFSPEWRHERIEQELEKVRSISSKRSASAKQRHSNSSANGVQKDTHLHSHSQRKKDAANAAPESSTEEVDLFRRGKKLLGDNAGGLIKNLLKAKEGKIPLARAALEVAATKQNPREYIGGVIRGADPPSDYVDPRL